jgi:hypothetical protein
MINNIVKIVIVSDKDGVCEFRKMVKQEKSTNNNEKGFKVISKGESLKLKKLYRRIQMSRQGQVSKQKEGNSRSEDMSFD